MIELRWYDYGNRTLLQYRTRQMTMDASGAFCGFSEWSEWMLVPTEHSYWRITNDYT